LLASNSDADVGAICAPPPTIDVIEPNANLSDGIQRRFEKFQKLYPALRFAFSESHPL
jgi:hypothetical protein